MTKIGINSKAGPNDVQAQIDELLASRDPADNVAGRLMAGISHPIRDWLHGEQKRNSNPGLCAETITKVLVMELSSIILTLAAPGNHRDALTRVAEMSKRAMVAIANSQELAVEAAKNDAAEMGGRGVPLPQTSKYVH
jgi:hypothetical protein